MLEPEGQPRSYGPVTEVLDSAASSVQEHIQTPPLSLPNQHSSPCSSEVAENKTPSATETEMEKSVSLLEDKNRKAYNKYKHRSQQFYEFMNKDKINATMTYLKKFATVNQLGKNDTCNHKKKELTKPNKTQTHTNINKEELDKDKELTDTEDNNNTEINTITDKHLKRKNKKDRSLEKRNNAKHIIFLTQSKTRYLMKIL